MDIKTAVLLMALMLVACPLYAGGADVLYADMMQEGGQYYFEVEVQHADAGWEHFANWWAVRTTDGKELARRVLAHPHDDEQPFTRAMQEPVQIPKGVKSIVVVANCKVHGTTGRTVQVNLSKLKAANYNIRVLKP